MLWGVKKWLWWALGVSAVFLLAVNMTGLTRLADRHEGVASWVQAIGAIGGIGLAIYFARADKADRKRSELKKAYALLQSLTGSIFLLDIELNRVQRVIDQYPQAAPDYANWDRWFRTGTIDIPKPLLDAMPFMQASEDDMVGRFRTVAMLAETFNAYMAKFSTLGALQVQNTWDRLYPQISGQLALLRQTVASITATT